MIEILFLLAAATETAPHTESQWREAATLNDEKRLDNWENAMDAGVSGAIKGEHKKDITSRAPLFDKDSALPNGKIPAGLYNCSTTKLDGKADAGLPYIAYPPFKCRIVDHGGRKHFTKLTGSQRTIGWIYEMNDVHSVYLGTLIYGYEGKLVPYGKTEKRDQAAVVHRIGPKRWRMVFPFPYYESVVDVMELTPVR